MRDSASSIGLSVNSVYEAPKNRVYLASPFHSGDPFWANWARRAPEELVETSRPSILLSSGLLGPHARSQSRVRCTLSKRCAVPRELRTRLRPYARGKHRVRTLHSVSDHQKLKAGQFLQPLLAALGVFDIYIPGISAILAPTMVPEHPTKTERRPTTL